VLQVKIVDRGELVKIGFALEPPAAESYGFPTV
jgi:hypothetical protein